MLLPPSANSRSSFNKVDAHLLYLRHTITCGVCSTAVAGYPQCNLRKIHKLYNYAQPYGLSPDAAFFQIMAWY